MRSRILNGVPEDFKSLNSKETERGFRSTIKSAVKQIKISKILKDIFGTALVSMMH